MTRTPDRSRDLAELANGFYEAAMDPTGWERELDSVRHFLDSAACAIERYDFHEQEGSSCCDVGLDATYAASHAMLLESLAQQMKASCGPGMILTKGAGIADEDLPRGRFYEKWMRPQGLFHCLCAVLARHGEEILYFAAYRPKPTGPYTPDEIAFVRDFLPNLSQAVRLCQRIRELKAGRHAAMEALNRLPLGVTMVNGRGMLVASNRRAQEIFTRSDGIAVVDGAVRTTEPSMTRSLRNLIAQATSDRSASGTRSSQALSIPRSSGLRPLLVVVSPVSPADPASTPDDPIAILFLNDPDSLGEIDEKWLTELYRLTPTEARVATLIAQGVSLAETAELLGIGIGTARNHLKQVFSKTDTRRQAELAAHLVAGRSMLLG